MAGETAHNHIKWTEGPRSSHPECSPKTPLAIPPVTPGPAAHTTANPNSALFSSLLGVLSEANDTLLA